VQVREKDWFEARMNLEREVETLKAALRRQKAEAERAGEERQELRKRVENLKVRLGEEAEEDGEEIYDEFSPANIVRRKEAREREEAEGRVSGAESSDGRAGDSEVRQLKMELEEVKQQVIGHGWVGKEGGEGGRGGMELVMARLRRLACRQKTHHTRRHIIQEEDTSY